LKINNDGESKVNVIAINIGREEEKWFKKLIFLSNLYSTISSRKG